MTHPKFPLKSSRASDDTPSTTDSDVSFASSIKQGSFSGISSLIPNSDTLPSTLASYNLAPKCLRPQPSLLVVINVHMLNLILDHSLEVDSTPCLSYLRLTNELPVFFKKVGYVSDSFFESALLSTKVFLETNTFHVIPKDLPQICSFASFFRAEVQSVFLHVDGPFKADEILSYSKVISGLELKLENNNDLEFLNKAALLCPRLKQLFFCDRISFYEGVVALTDVLKVNTTITSIDLGNNSIGVAGARALAEALKVNLTITCIEMSGNSIGEEGAKELAEALKVNSTITSVDLSENFLGDEGAKELAEALKVNATVTAIRMSGNSIGDEGARELADALKVNAIVNCVDLSENFIGDEGAEALADTLKINSKMTSINLRENYIGDEGAEALVEALKVRNFKNSFLTEIFLDLNSDEDEGSSSN
ncbi:hypothetical protein GEMRC1_009488 [Eukaryota sp. GEM-RC1]